MCASVQVLEALNILDSAEETGTSSGGAKFIIVISDALMVQDIVIIPHALCIERALNAGMHD